MTSFSCRDRIRRAQCLTVHRTSTVDRQFFVFTAMKGAMATILTAEAGSCMHARRALWSSDRGHRVITQAASTVVRTPVSTPSISLQMRGLQEFAAASLDGEPTYVQRDVTVRAPPPPPHLTGRTCG